MNGDIFSCNLLSAGAALLGVFISNRSQERRLEIQFEFEQEAKELRLRKEKLEEMFILFQKWETDISTTYLSFNGVYRGETSFSDAQALSSDCAMQEKGDYQRFQAILNLYFPELADSFLGVMEKRKRVMDFCSHHASPSNETLDSFYKTQEEFESQTADFRSEMAKYAKRL